MAKKVSSVSITQPSVANTYLKPGDSFTFGAQVVLTGGGSADYDMEFLMDNAWKSSPDRESLGSSTDLSTTDTNPITSITTDAEQTIAVTCENPGIYDLLIRTTDHNDGDSTDESGPAPLRRINVRRVL